MGEIPKVNELPAESFTGADCRCAAKWKLPLLLTAVLAAILLINGRGVRRPIPSGSSANATQVDAVRNSGTSASAENSRRQFVSLTIDFGDGQRRESQNVPWHDGITVAAALAHVAENSAGKLSFSQHGSGTSALLIEMDDVANEGYGLRNWIYRVNGIRADRSFAVYELRPGDEVLWTFEGRSR